MRALFCLTVVILAVFMLTLNLFVGISIEGDNDTGFKDRNGAQYKYSLGNYLDRQYIALTESEILRVYRSNTIEPTVKYKFGTQQTVFNQHRQYRVRDFNVEDVVRCFDALSAEREKRPMHIAFIGDSTVRNHFLNFLQLFPNYDRQIQAVSSQFAEHYFHEDRNITIPLMDNLLISFRWRNFIRNDLIDDFKKWISVYRDVVPDFILLGFTLHHIRKNNLTANLEEYGRILEHNLLPYIKQSMTAHPQLQIVWLHQSAVMDYNGPAGIDVRKDRNISSDSIRHYNHKIHDIFRNTRVMVWSSVSVIVEEYLRACGLGGIQRWDRKEYLNCLDITHPGFGALSVANQLIINHLCSVN